MGVGVEDVEWAVGFESGVGLGYLFGGVGGGVLGFCVGGGSIGNCLFLASKS